MTKKAAQKEEFMKKKLTASVLAVASVLSMSTGMVFADETTAEVPEIEMADASEVDKTTISFWHSMGGVNGQAIDTLVQKFNDENEYGITVEAEYQGSYDDALNELKSAQIGNMGADLVQPFAVRVAGVRAHAAVNVDVHKSGEHRAAGKIIFFFSG